MTNKLLFWIIFFTLSQYFPPFSAQFSSKEDNCKIHTLSLVLLAILFLISLLSCFHLTAYHFAHLSLPASVGWVALSFLVRCLLFGPQWWHFLLLLLLLTFDPMSTLSTLINNHMPFLILLSHFSYHSIWDGYVLVLFVFILWHIK